MTIGNAIVLAMIVYVAIVIGCFAIFLILLPTILYGRTRRERVMATMLAIIFLLIMAAMGFT